MSDLDFESKIPMLSSLSETFDLKVYVPLPDDWVVVVADVAGSTQAIAEGRYRQINTLGGSTIAAVLNAVKPLKVPYVFGGDGASFCVPPEVVPQLEKALRGCQELAQNLKLRLRVGLVPCREMTSQVLVCRFKDKPTLTQYYFMGGGMEEADTRVKQNPRYHLDEKIPAEADFSGFECRWNEVPSSKDVTFSLLVKANADWQHNLECYAHLTRQLETLFGDAVEHHPLKPSKLSLSFHRAKLYGEAVVKSMSSRTPSKWSWILLLQNLIGTYWIKFGRQAMGADWGHYKQDLIENTDYLKLDDTFRTVMTGTQASVAQLLAWLESEHKQGHLFYGCHQTHSAIVTCLVQKTGIEHIHFVDSAEGGYAAAAKQLKSQMAQVS